MCEIKKCGKCLVEKSILEFNKSKNKKLGVASICKSCHSNYRKKHYLLNKNKVISQVKDYNYNELISEKRLLKYGHLKDIFRFNIKSGRFLEYECFECNDLVCASKKEILDKIKIKCLTCKNKTKKTLVYYYLKNIEKRALIKNLSFNLDEEFLTKLLDNQGYKCNLSGVDIILNLKGKTINTASIDRKDSKIGYIKENVQWVALPINYMKSNYKEEDIIDFLKLLKKS